MIYFSCDLAIGVSDKMFLINFSKTQFFFIISRESRKMILDSEFTKRNILSTIGIMKTFIDDGGGGEYQNRKGEKKILLSNLIW